MTELVQGECRRPTDPHTAPGMSAALLQIASSQLLSMLCALCLFSGAKHVGWFSQLLIKHRNWLWVAA